MMEEEGIESGVDMKYFRERATIEEDLQFSNRHVYRINHKGTSYILKKYKTPYNSKDASKTGLEQIIEAYEEYYFMKAACSLSSHFIKPLCLNYKLEAEEDKIIYKCIEVIYEYGGVFLNSLKEVTIKLGYNLMQQAANALAILHNTGRVHLDISASSMAYDDKTDLLKFIDTGYAFHSEEMRTIISKSISPEILQEVQREAVDVHCWAECFRSVSYTHLTLPTICSV
eukprot:TRINITY_DN6588_c0_g1_i4.p1 TRINITY_DN6588_c0_g1~~TRINITY_DN6588_c0_g1_i4.p1  ORF type:complete len:228 (-),score=16.67 TRINITY_DN6588_c0_g1_i4:41-724(-)